MSIAAMNWAMAQRTGKPSAQCVLYVVADVAGPDGVAWPSMRYLANRSEQSVASVRRRLKDLEEQGLLVRFERHDETGRRTSDEIRLSMGAAAADMAEKGAQEQAPEAAATPSRPSGGDPARLQGAPATAESGGPSQLSQGIEPSLEPDSPPQSPPGGAVTADSGLERFKAAYPCATTRVAERDRLWAALGPGERERAITGAAGYAVHCDRYNRKPMDPCKFLRDPGLWAEHARLAPKPEPGKAFVGRGTPEWAGLCVLRAVMFGREQYLPPVAPPGTEQAKGREGALVPEGVDLKALAAHAGFASEHGRPDFDAWLPCQEGTKQWFAWADRVRRCGLGRLEAECVQVPGETETARMPDGTEFEAPRRVNGCLVPSEWPPRLTAGAPEREQQEETQPEGAGA